LGVVQRCTLPFARLARPVAGKDEVCAALRSNVADLETPYGFAADGNRLATVDHLKSEKLFKIKVQE